jgi:4-azaleucine resistance transporter AzlC
VSATDVSTADAREAGTSTAAELRAGIGDIMPAMVAAIPIGLLFGAVAASKGLSVAEVALMSALVCAGGAQLAVIEIWGYPVPVVAVLFATLLVNLRHVLMGASLAPKLGLFRPWHRALTFYTLTDEDWAFAERRVAAGRRLTPAYFGIMGAVLWANWVTCSALGAALGPLLGDPRRLGADFAFTALFIGLIAGLWRGRSTGFVVAASAIAAAAAYRFLGSPWHVAAGAFAGIAAGALAWRGPAEEAVR